MQVVYQRCCGLDIHKKLIVACLLLMSAQGVQKKEIRTFSATLADLYRLRDWLVANECQMVAMESTGVYTPPPMLPIGGDILRRGWKGGRTDAKDHADLLSIHLDPFDQSTDDLSFRLKIGLLQLILHFGRKSFQAAQNHTHLLFHL